MASLSTEVSFYDDIVDENDSDKNENEEETSLNNFLDDGGSSGDEESDDDIKSNNIMNNSNSKVNSSSNTKDLWSDEDDSDAIDNNNYNAEDEIETDDDENDNDSDLEQEDSDINEFETGNEIDSKLNQTESKHFQSILNDTNNQSANNSNNNNSNNENQNDTTANNKDSVINKLMSKIKQREERIESQFDNAIDAMNNKNDSNNNNNNNNTNSIESESDYSSEDVNLEMLMKAMNPNVTNLAELSDSSVESEGDLIRTGNVPTEWYDKELHDGYDIDGNKVVARGMGDEIDQWLRTRDKETLKRTIYDEKNDRMRTLSDRDLAIIKRIRKGQSAGMMYDPGLPETEVYDITVSGHRPKTSFIISKSQYKTILSNVNAIRKGKMKVDKYGKIESKNKKKAKKFADLARENPFRIHSNYMYQNKGSMVDIWENKKYEPKIHRDILQAPKSRVPGNEESYNPPKEYLFSQKQKVKFEEIAPQDRNGRIMPMKFDAMRKIPQFDRYIHERFERCLDLYLCPRKVRKKTMINPKDMLPKLPNINDLKPFPELLTLEFKGHAQPIRCCAVSPCGSWIATGSDDGTVRVWEVETGREYWRHSFGVENRIEDVSFNPLQHRPILSVVCKHRCILIPLQFISNNIDYNAHVLSIINKIKQHSINPDAPNADETDSNNSNANSGRKMIIPRLNLQETMKLFKQNLLEELAHWPEIIDRMINEFGWNIPNMFENIGKSIQKYQNSQNLKKERSKQLQNEETKTNTTNETDDNNNNKDEEDSDMAEITELNSNNINIAVRWSFLTFHNYKSNTLIGNYQLINNNIICLSFLNYLKGIRWHNKGDYFATFRNEKQSSSLIIHRLSKFESQIPLSSPIGEIQDLLFHPRKPLIYIACKQSIRCFNLASCKLQEKYKTTVKWITRFDLHHSGLNMIVGGLNGRVCWYDMDLSHVPFKTFRFHKECAVRGAVFHPNWKKYKLWATCGDDGRIFIFYCFMFRDRLADPIIIPLKILYINKNKVGIVDRGKDKQRRHRILNIQWHPTQPWIFAACSDSILRMYTAL